MKNSVLNPFGRQYIWRDLRDPDVFSVSIVIWLIFFIASLFSTLGLAFPEVSDFKRKQHLLDNPNALRLIFNPPFGGNFNDSLDGRVVNPLKEKLKSGLQPLLDSGVIQSIQERSRISLEWFKAPSQSSNEVEQKNLLRTIIRGRVLQTGDPCLKGQPLETGEAITDSDSLFGKSGSDSIPIVVTRNFFLLLGGKPGESNEPVSQGTKLQFSFRGQDESFPCTVAGILKDDQPTDGDFFMRKSDLQPKILKVIEDNRLASAIILGGVEGKALRTPAVRKVIEELGLRSPFPVPEGNETRYRLALTDLTGGEKVSYWEKTVLGKLSAAMPKENTLQIKEFVFRQGRVGSLPGTSDCDGVIVHSKDLGGLPLIHQEFRKVFSTAEKKSDGSIDEDSIDDDKIPKLQNPDIVNQISQIESSTSWNRIAIWTQLIIASLSLVFSLSALIAVRLGQKRSEIGLLRMLGISSSKLVWMFIFQSWLLCILGMLPGIVLGLFVMEISRHLGLDFYWSRMGPFFGFLLIYFVLHFVFLALGVWFGSRNSLNQSPAKWLNVT